MSNRPHAHSKRRRSAPPRSYNSATGLHGATEAELAYRARITEAALAEVERSVNKTARPARFTQPKANRGPAPRSPRTFSLPSEPVRAPDAGAEARIDPDPVVPTGTDPVVPTGTDSGAGVSRPTISVDASSRQGEVHPATSPGASLRPRRALATRLSAAMAASGAVASRAKRSARRDRADDPTVAPSPDAASAEGTDATTPAAPVSTPTRSAEAGSPSPKASRAPKGGSRWRRSGAGEDQGRGSSRPPKPSRPESTRGPTSGVRRLAVPLAGRKKKSETAPQKNVPSTPSARSAPAKQAPAKQKKPARQKTPASPDQRRRRIPVAIAGAFALAVLATGFPLSSILSQHHQLAAAGAQLEQVQRENRDLAQQEHALDSSVAVTQLARGEYQMVTPGQTLYDVLPPSSRTGRSGKTTSTAATGSTTPGSAVNGDPGNQPLVAPSNAPDLTAQAALAQPTPVEAAASTSGVSAKGSVTASPAASTAPSTPTTFWGRVGQTLQFWK